MRKIVIKIGLVTMLLILIVSTRKINAYTNTGHEDFVKIVAPASVKLLNQYTENEINKKIKNIPFSMFGWKTIYENYEVPITYDGKVIFARKNKTSQTIKIDYTLTEIETTTTSVSVKGSISTKISGKIKKINTDLSGEGKIEYENKNISEYEIGQKTTLSLIVKPNTSLSLITTGEAIITNGVSRYNFFGITFRKGGWERIDVVTMYYEFREDNLADFEN